MSAPMLETRTPAARVQGVALVSGLASLHESGETKAREPYQGILPRDFARFCRVWLWSRVGLLLHKSGETKAREPYQGIWEMLQGVAFFPVFRF